MAQYDTLALFAGLSILVIGFSMMIFHQRNELRNFYNAKKAERKMSDSAGILAESPPPPSSEQLSRHKAHLDNVEQAESKDTVDEKSDANQQDEASWADPDAWIGIFALAFLVMVFLPLAPIESDVTQIYGHEWIMAQSCEGILTPLDDVHCWDYDGKSDSYNYSWGLFWLWGIGLLIGFIGMVIWGISESEASDAGMIVGGLVILAAVILGPVAWLWGILALAWMEILHFNVLWILDVFFLTISLAGIIVFSMVKKARTIEFPFRLNKCKATTRSNNDCGNNKMEGSDYCSVHRCNSHAAYSENFEDSPFHLQNGTEWVPGNDPKKRCTNKREKGSQFCLAHGGGDADSTESSPNPDPAAEAYVRQLVAQGYPEETARAYAQQYYAQIRG